MKRYIFLWVILVGLFLPPTMAHAGDLQIIGHYTEGDSSFDVATYTEGGEKVAIVGISHKVSITFKKSEWRAFVAFWQKAEKSQADTFHFIGSYKETGTSYPSLLTMSAGPGVLFTISDKPGTFSFVLQPKDFADFDAAVAKNTALLDSN